MCTPHPKSPEWEVGKDGCGLGGVAGGVGDVGRRKRRGVGLEKVGAQGWRGRCGFEQKRCVGGVVRVWG